MRLHTFSQITRVPMLLNVQKIQYRLYNFSKSDFYESDVVLKKLENLNLIWLLAGFLWLIPAKMVAKYANKVSIFIQHYCQNLEGKGCMEIMYTKRWLKTEKRKAG